jgi:single-stranded-DNA-specific exonuclease
VKHAKSLGVDVIITDHHAVPKEIPKDAIALINPKNPACTYPFK